MPVFSRQRTDRFDGSVGFPSSILHVAFAWSTLTLWTCALIWSSLQSVRFWREWQSSSSSSTIVRGVVSSQLYGVSPPVNRARQIWRELYSIKDDTDETTVVAHNFKPRTWPREYESMVLYDGSNAETLSHALPWQERNVTFHRLHLFPETCKPRSEWHSYSFPNCNTFHEIDLEAGIFAAGSNVEGVVDKTGELRIQYGFNGATRESWFLDSKTCSNGEHHCPGTTILKTLRWRELHDEQIHDLQRIDALVSERLSSSPHVIDIYGYCGASALNDFADGGMFAQAFRHRYSNKKNHSGYSDKELLVFARDAALGLADIHDIDGGKGNITSFVHHDLRAENYLMSNGTIMISDFNNGQLLRWDFAKNKSCDGFNWSGGCGKTIEQTNRKAPEECREEKDRTFTTEKVEVYRFGAFLFFLISKGNWPYSYEPLNDGTLGRPEPSKVKKLILSGKGPSLPPYVKESNSTAMKAIVHAMRMAHTFDSEKRPSTREIADHLVKAIEIEELAAPIRARS